MWRPERGKEEWREEGWRGLGISPAAGGSGGVEAVQRASGWSSNGRSPVKLGNGDAMEGWLGKEREWMRDGVGDRFEAKWERGRASVGL